MGDSDSYSDKNIELQHINSLSNSFDNIDNIKDDIKNESNLKTPWNRRIVLLLKKIGERSLGYRWMHNEERKHYERMNYIFLITEMIILALLGGISGGQFIGLISNIGLKNNKITIGIIISIQLLLLLVYAIIKGFREIGDYPALIFDHKYNSTKFGAININIQEQMALDIPDRDTDVDFLKNILKEYNTNLFEAPKIREKTMKRYMKVTKDSKIYRPIDIGDIDTIEIVIDNDKNTGLTTVNNEEKKLQFKNSDEKYNYEMNKWLQNF